MLSKISSLLILLFYFLCINAQVDVDIQKFNKANGVSVNKNGNSLSVKWPVNKNDQGQLIFNLEKEKPLLTSVQIIRVSKLNEILKDAAPAFPPPTGNRTWYLKMAGIFSLIK